MGKSPVWARRKKTETKTHVKKKNSFVHNTKKELKKSLKSKKGITCDTILRLAKTLPRFIGCFSADKINKLQFPVKPVYLIVNTDNSGQTGSHWLVIAVFSRVIEVFDPLGFQIFRWPRIPCEILKFLHSHSVNRKIILSDRVQSRNSILCGFYCLFYIYSRPVLSLKQITSLFSKQLCKNDKILKSLF